MKKIIFFLIFALSIILLSPHAFAWGTVEGEPASDMFIKIASMNGEAQDSAHRGWFDVVRYEHQKSGPNRRLEIMKVTVRKDGAAPALAAAFRDKKVFSNATLEDLSSPGKYIKIELIDVIVTKCETGTATVDLALTFGEIQWSYG